MKIFNFNVYYVKNVKLSLIIKIKWMKTHKFNHLIYILTKTDHQNKDKQY
jgi:hypothetical protein